MPPTVATAPMMRPQVASLPTAFALAAEHEAEVLEFLAERPLHTVRMVGLIRDNGLVSPLNRGTFYACRDAEGAIEGVALIGHAVVFEARTEEAVAAFARLAQSCPQVHMLLAEQERVEQFWHHYSEGGRAARLACRELLMEQRWPVAVLEGVEGLRRATSEDLDLIVPVQAELAFEESGVNPLEKDPEGFRRRCARRVELGRTWVVVAGGQLLFKAEVFSDTPDCVYLEGIWVNPQERGKGFGRRCMSQLSRDLLGRTRSVSILVNEGNKPAQQLYRRAGYKMKGTYDTIFLQQGR